GAPRGRAAPMPVRTPSPRRAESGRARGSLPAGGPVHAPPVGVVDGALGAHPAFRDQVAGLALDDEVAVAGAGDQGEGAHRGGDGALVEREVDRGAVLRPQGDRGVEVGEGAGALVDGDEDEDAPEGLLVVEVDGEVLTAGDGTGAVVAVEVDVRGLVQGAEGVAEGLDHTLAAVGEFVQGAQVEVEVGVLGDRAAQLGRPARELLAHLPVEVHVQGARGAALLGEGDRRGRLGERHLGQPHRRRGGGGRRGRGGGRRRHRAGRGRLGEGARRGRLGERHLGQPHRGGGGGGRRGRGGGRRRYRAGRGGLGGRGGRGSGRRGGGGLLRLVDGDAVVGGESFEAAAVA